MGADDEFDGKGCGFNSSAVVCFILQVKESKVGGSWARGPEVGGGSCCEELWGAGSITSDQN